MDLPHTVVVDSRALRISPPPRLVVEGANCNELPSARAPAQQFLHEFPLSLPGQHTLASAHSSCAAPSGLCKGRGRPLPAVSAQVPLTLAVVSEFLPRSKLLVGSSSPGDRLATPQSTSQGSAAAVQTLLISASTGRHCWRASENDFCRTQSCRPS